MLYRARGTIGSLWAAAALLVFAACGSSDDGATTNTPDDGKLDGSPDGTSSGADAGDSGAPDTTPLPPYYTLDFRTYFTLIPTTKETRGAAYDTLVAATCLQGLANREGANLYVDFAQSAAPSSVDLDTLWLKRIVEDPKVGKGLLDRRTAIPLADVNAALDTFKDLVKGLVVWDDKVPATINAAFAVAGADDLVAVRWDASPTSLYSTLRAKGLPVKAWLVNEDGSSLFTDNATTVPGTTRASTKSAKDDVYLWVVEKYQKAKKLNPTEYGYMLDAVWINDPNAYDAKPRSLGLMVVTNRDYLVANRGFPLDLSPWADVAATDAPKQTPGLERNLWSEILFLGRAMAKDTEILSVRGFMPWEYKYSDKQGLEVDTYSPVHGEWESAKLISSFAGGLDADGLGAMTNASFFQHVPLDSLPEQQPRPTPEDLVGNGFLTGLASNGGFEDGAAGWTLKTTNVATITDNKTTGARAHGGLRYLEWSGADAANNTVYREGAGVGVGGTVTLRAFVKSATGTVKGTAAIFALGGTTESASVAFTATTTWTEVRVTLPIKTAGHTTTRGQFYVDPTGKNIDLDDVAFYEGNAADGTVEKANYAMWFVGDYDSSEWMYRYSPNTWDSPARGIVPFAWPFSGNAIRRFPVFYNYVRSTKTPRDFFVGADSGPAYGNPGAMDAPARAIWKEAGTRAARFLDSSTGWVLDPRDVLDPTHLDAVTPFFGDGVIFTGGVPGSIVDGTLVDGVPVVKVGSPGIDGAGILARTTAPPPNASFTAWRVTQGSFLGDGRPAYDVNSILVDLSNDFVTNRAAGKYRFVDPYSFFALAKRSLGGSNAYRASYLSVEIAPPTVGKPVHVVATLRNDGWDTWAATGAMKYVVGFDLATTPAKVGSLPATGEAYAVRANLPNDVPPGGSVKIEVDLAAIPDTAPRTLQIDVARAGTTWFESQKDIPFQASLSAH